MDSIKFFIKRYDAWVYFKIFDVYAFYIILLCCLEGHYLFAHFKYLVFFFVVGTHLSQSGSYKNNIIDTFLVILLFTYR